MAARDTTVEPTPVVESETPRSSISAGEVAQPYEMLGRSLDKLGEGLEQLATPLAEQAGYKAVATDDQGNMTVSRVPIFGPAGAAYSRAVKFSSLVQAEGEAKREDIKTSKQYPNDPEAYLSAANQFRDTLVKNVSAQAGNEVGLALSRSIDETTTFNYRRLAGEQQETIKRNLDKTTQWAIEQNRENLITGIKNGLLDTPEGIEKAKGFIKNIDAALNERTNPILGAPKAESDKIHFDLGRDMDAAKFEARVSKTLANPAAPYQGDIETSAGKYKLDPTLFARQLWQESHFNENATSPAGAQGIAQFMPETARQYGVNVRNPQSSIEGAAHYMSDLSTRFGGNTGLALAAYNWGPEKLEQWIANGSNPSSMPRETRNYVQAITGQPIDAWISGKRPSAFAIQNLPSQYSLTGGAQKALDMVEAERANNPDKAQGQLNYERGLAAIKDYHDGVVRRTNMSELGQKTRDETFLNSVISDTDGAITDNDIRTTPGISPNIRENAIRFKKQEDMPEPLARVSQRNEMDAFKRMQLPADDPNRISTVSQISDVYTNADGKGGTTREGFEWLMKKLVDVRNEQGDPFSKARTDFSKSVEPYFDKSTMTNIDGEGKLRAYEFERWVDGLVNYYKANKKDPFDLITPGNPRYLGNRDVLNTFQSSLQQQINEMTKRLTGGVNPPAGGSTIPTPPPIVAPAQAAPAVVPRQPGESLTDYDKRAGIR